MGTDSSGLPLCEPGSRGLGFSFQLPDLASFSFFLRSGRPVIRLAPVVTHLLLR